MKRGDQDSVAAFFPKKRSRPTQDALLSRKQSSHTTKPSNKPAKFVEKHVKDHVTVQEVVISTECPIATPENKKEDLNTIEVGEIKNEEIAKRATVNPFCNSRTSILAPNHLQDSRTNPEREMNDNLEQTIMSLKEVNDELKKVHNARQGSVCLDVSSIHENALKKKRENLLLAISTMAHSLQIPQSGGACTLTDVHQVKDDGDSLSENSDVEEEEEETKVLTKDSSFTLVELASDLEVLVQSIKTVNDQLRGLTTGPNNAGASSKVIALKAERMRLLDRMRAVANEAHSKEEEKENTKDSSMISAKLASDLEVLVQSIKAVNDQLRSLTTGPNKVGTSSKVIALKAERMRLLDRMRAVAEEAHSKEEKEETKVVMKDSSITSAKLASNLESLVQSIKTVNDKLRSVRTGPNNAGTSSKVIALKAERMGLLDRMRAVAEEAHSKETSEDVPVEKLSKAQLSKDMEAIVYSIKSVNDQLRECRATSHHPQTHCEITSMRVWSLKAARTRLLDRMRALSEQARSLNEVTPLTSEQQESRPFAIDAMEVARDSLVEFVSGVVGKLTKMKPNGGPITAADVASVLG